MTQSATTTVTVSTVHSGPVGGAIFTGRDESGRWIRAVADREAIFRAPLRGEIWRLTGRFNRHHTYGIQLYVERSQLLRPTGRLLVRHLATHPSFRGIGIGMARASRLYKEFGERLTELLDDGDANALTKVLDEEVARMLAEAWRANAQEASTVMFLELHGVDVRLAGKILRYWPENAVEKLKENPYRLLALSDWPAVDRLARSLGVGADDERRLIAATEASVYQRLDVAKDTLNDDASLRGSVSSLLNCRDSETSRKAIELSLYDGAIVGDSDIGYQSFGCAVMERYLMERFRGMVHSAEGISLPLFGYGADASNINACIYDFERRERIALNDEQRAAVVMAATEPLSVLTGGAGVGKTTVLKAVGDFVEAAGGQIIQMALAGRAAQKLREATGREAHTIVGFLNQVRSGKIVLDSGSLVVVDESSMLDLMLLYRLVRILPQGVRLLLVGDSHQLPPIGPGLVFHVIADSPVLKRRGLVCELTRVHRQAESSGIPEVARLVRNGLVPELGEYEGRTIGVSFLACNADSITDHLVDIVNDLGGFGDTQILGVTKSGQAGVASINQTFHQKLTARKHKLSGWDIAETDPVIYTVNDYDRELYNGSLGRVDKVFDELPKAGSDEEEPCRAICDFDGRKLRLSDSELCNMELAYAITTHKAQGSQFKQVVIPITKSRLLDRTLIYTALTRGVEKVVFVGDRRAFNEAIVSPPTVTRRCVGFTM